MPYITLYFSFLSILLKITFLFILHRILMKNIILAILAMCQGGSDTSDPRVPYNLYFTQFIPETQKLNNRNLQRLMVGNRSCIRMSEMSVTSCHPHSRIMKILKSFTSKQVES